MGECGGDGVRVKESPVPPLPGAMIDSAPMDDHIHPERQAQGSQNVAKVNMID